MRRRLDLTVLVRRRGWGGSVVARLKDISISGTFLEGPPEAFPLYSLVQLEATPPGGASTRLMTCKAVVARVGPNGVGLVFDQIRPAGLAPLGVETTLEQFRAMEKGASPQDLLDWRFQQGLYRAYYDAYNRRRLLYETELEKQALDELLTARPLGALRALDRAEAVLDRAVTERVASDLRQRVFELAEALYQSIRAQLDVERYKAIAVGRGANLALIDTPLNNRLWLKERFEEIRAEADETKRLAGIQAILAWTHPGPGGFYDDLGGTTVQPHLVPGKSYEQDPQYFESPVMAFGCRPGSRLSWCDFADGLYGYEVKLHYPRLDPEAEDKV